MTDGYMCEISHGQASPRRIFRVSPLSRALCDISRMATNLDIQAIRDRITTEMERKGFSKRGLSLKLGGPTLLRDVLDRTDNPGIGTLFRIAEAIDMTLEDIIGVASVPLLGEIGAGGAIAFFKDDHEFETVPRPPLSPGPLMALCVAGESMLPKYEPGDIIYVRRDHDGVLPTYMGEYCAVHLADGGTYLKILAEGSQPDRYTLRSLNAADMTNVEVIWAAPVLFIMPRRARAK
jgi:phage repressor protein C with HTH and peptisase S24 domain